jgi:putative nucleotidyltransferase with HDIG domain
MSTVEAAAPLPFHSDDPLTELVARARTREGSRLVGGEGTLAVALAAGFLVSAIGAAVFLPAIRPFSPFAAVAAVAAYAIVCRVGFEVGNGHVIPTQLVLVPMLFMLPPRIVPLLVVAGFLAGHSFDLVRHRLPVTHIPLLIFNGSHALGPAIVLALAGGQAPAWQRVPLYCAALAAQFAADFVPSAIWSRGAWGVSLLEHARATRVAFLIDTALAPVAFAVAIGSSGSPWSVLLVLPLVGVLQVFARDRQIRIDHALELSTAYRGTAMLLGDVIEADDEYTGTHSRDVVQLVLAVADKLGLDPRQRQRAEFAALLHDVGKVKIPPGIINKPGPLDDGEREVMNTHTVVGQQMLEQVGGPLGDIGRVVRSCHEHWDGGGYPDGLGGEEISFEARIVSACDAWSAMTTDRSYRKALPNVVALAELQACSGTQFEPRVVDALVAVLELQEAAII